MSNSTVAKRYALALFELAEEKDLLDQFEQELDVVKQVFMMEPNLMTVLESPKFPMEKKKEIIKNTFASVHPLLLNTLMILIERHRHGYIKEVADNYLELANEARGIAVANAYSVRELTDEELDALSTSFAKKVGKKALRINNIIDSNLLGGVKLQIGNKIFDGSLQGKIERLGRKLLLG